MTKNAQTCALLQTLKHAHVHTVLRLPDALLWPSELGAQLCHPCETDETSYAQVYFVSARKR